MVHKVPQGSFQNRIELTVENTSSNEARWITVEAKNPPSWQRFEKPAITIDEIKSQTEAIAYFKFSVHQSVPVGTNHTLLFVIRSTSGEQWEKEIHVVIVRPSIPAKIMNGLRRRWLKG